MGIFVNKHQSLAPSRSAFVLTLGVCLLAALAGCSNPAAGLGAALAVKGKVTMDGGPAAGVEVTFARVDKGAPPEFRNFSTRAGADGAYQFPKIYAGEYMVMIYDRAAEQKPPEQGAPAGDVGPYAKYGVNSPLKAVVASDKLEHNFELTSAAQEVR